MAPKKKTLPAGFAQLLKTESHESLVAVFDTCEIDAYGGNSKATALGFGECPEALARWLVEQGADVNARDSHKDTPLHAWAARSRADLGVLVELGADVHAQNFDRDTPLHAAARAHSVAAASALIAVGADVNAEGRLRATPLDGALSNTDNLNLATAPQIVEFLLASGAQVSSSGRDSVTRVGTEFEAYKSGFSAERITTIEPALHRLYELTGVAAVAAPLRHDGASG